jgi:hypothetical protein
MESEQTEPQTQEGLPWHKPEVRRLTVSLNTDQKAGSAEDTLSQSGRQPGPD